MWENTDNENSEYRHFLRSDKLFTLYESLCLSEICFYTEYMLSKSKTLGFC